MLLCKVAYLKFMTPYVHVESGDLLGSDITLRAILSMLRVVRSTGSEWSLTPVPLPSMV